MSNTTRYRNKPGVRIELSSLIDMAFLLLIFFLLVTLTPQVSPLVKRNIEHSAISSSKTLLITCSPLGTLSLNDKEISRKKLLQHLNTYTAKPPVILSVVSPIATPLLVETMNAIVSRGFYDVRLQTEQ